MDPEVPAAPEAPPKQLRRARRRSGPGLPTIAVFLAPALILYSLFTLGPLVAVGSFSVFKWAGAKNIGFAGLDNFATLLRQGTVAGEIFNGFLHNVYFFVGTMIIQNSIGLLLAILLNSRVRGKRFFQTSSALPFLVNPLVVGYVWTLLLDPLYGPFAGFLKAIGRSDLVHPWLGDPVLVQPIVILINAWQWIGFPMLIFSAALAGIPEELTSAARVDGASRFQIFRYVTLPLLAPAFGTITILTFIGSFNAFNLQYAVGGVNGAPAGQTDVLGLVFYRLAFGSGSNATGLSSALAVVIFVFVFGCALVLRRIVNVVEDRLS
ncbi:carbohydrate ABC transporter permease [Leifsonia sp. AG29]|uniref:carbohydrate ABC transporter permease n=1 Tax=Leifsonia sp. AG29 TaxID=2598860 RepID=UPI0018EF1549|nr:sugar ABC transporter permease [Leifsonia sp. AG29]